MAVLSKPDQRHLLSALSIGLAVTTARGGDASYRVVSLPPDISVYKISAGVLGGTTGQHATIWLNEGSEAINLDPGSTTDGYDVTQVWGLRGTQQQVGRFGPKAALWNGSSESVVVLSSGSSIALDTDGTYQVGQDEGSHPVLWNGTAASAVRLTPTWGMGGVAYSIDNGTQGGSVWTVDGEHAVVWHGTAESAVDVHPTGYSSSYIRSLRGGQMVGEARLSNSAQGHAALWVQENAGAFVDLHPAGFLSSGINSTNGHIQVGSGVFQAGTIEVGHALAWSGSADSVVDLGLLLPSRFFRSVARSVDVDGTIVVEGWDGSSYQDFLLVVPEPGHIALFATSLAVILGRAVGRDRRRRSGGGVRGGGRS